MKVANIKIDGYRLLNDFEMDLRDDLSLVIGKNNTGKTSLLNLLSAYLSDTNPKFALEDFSMPIQKRLMTSLISPKKAEPDPRAHISLILEISYNEDDNLRHLSKLMVDLSPEARTVHLRFTSVISEESLAALRRDLAANKSAIEAAVKGKPSTQQAAEDAKKYVSKHIGQYLTTRVVSFDPKDSYELDLTEELALVRRVLNLEYVSARRAVENRVSGRGGKSAGRALAQLSSDYFKNHTGSNESSAPFLQLAAQAAVADRKFTETYGSVFEELITKISRFGVPAGPNADIHVVSEIQPGNLLSDSTTVQYGEPDSLLPEDHNGLGYLNLIAIIMEIEIRLLRVASAHGNEASEINILVIEEPEAHTHPQLQYIFIRRIKELLSEHKAKGSLNLQTVITTHSSHITAESDFSDLKYFVRHDDRVTARNMTDLEARYGNDKQAYFFLKQYLTLTRAELFFADKAVLIEGDTERILMRAMMKKIDDADRSIHNPLSSQNISIVEVGAHSQVFDHFIEFTGLRVLIITDLDSAKVVTQDKKVHLEGCRVSEGTHTSNSALKHYFGLTRSEITDHGDLESLLRRGYEEKQLANIDGSWQVDLAAPTMFVAYQMPEDGYEATSYEDSFIHLNREYIDKRRDSFLGLKNRRYFSEESKDAFDLARECVKKKTHFALDIIYSDNASEGETWAIPSYIAEGLRWLRDVS